ncbi:hypothetical protein [Sphingomonas parapaucimobilis]|uniref:Uncharacterized protein n=1 Tax=Sphingomonas parapaucimobilis NBRC 15100 TaxID=1219049 RepID=A0A0A1WAE0_9SPHN|nr:hypothetical protein [Sphingomonas parapaucimobilis]GAM01894.1 hypothetical protein SP5_069_01380 [Sphingomonas parapaucimobilis NBRC 15100]
MTEYSFTPGPWHAQACNSWNVWSKDCKVADPIRCAQAEPYRVPSDEERIANARLIAASPTLLEALEGLVAKSTDTDGDWSREWAAALAAITLATGKDA